MKSLLVNGSVLIQGSRPRGGRNRFDIWGSHAAGVHNVVYVQVDSGDYWLFFIFRLINEVDYFYPIFSGSSYESIYAILQAMYLTNWGGLNRPAPGEYFNASLRSLASDKLEFYQFVTFIETH